MRVFQQKKGGLLERRIREDAEVGGEASLVTQKRCLGNKGHRELPQIGLTVDTLLHIDDASRRFSRLEGMNL